MKKHRKNSVIFRDENKIEFAKHIGISYTSYKKYYKLSHENGLLTGNGKNVQVKNIVRCIHLLGLTDRIKRCHSIFNNYEYTEITFTSVYDRIIESIIINNYERQQHKIDSNNILFDKFPKDDCTKKVKNQMLKQLCKKSRKLNTATDTLLKSIQGRRIKKIVTGKYHVANLIGYSPSSGLRRLRKMVREKRIKRKVVTKIIPCVPDFSTYDYLRSTMTKGQCLIPCKEGFKNFLGSSVRILAGFNTISIPIRRTKKTKEGCKSITC